jgi:hypothetical protein
MEGCFFVEFPDLHAFVELQIDDLFWEYCRILSFSYPVP